MALEACGADPDDLNDPAVREAVSRMSGDPAWRQAFERMQRFDAEMSMAFRDVPVPPGLAGRLVDNLRPAAAESSPSAAVARSQPWLRRAVLLAAATVAVTVTLSFWQSWRNGPRYTLGGAVEEVVAFFHSDQAAPGFRLSDTPAPPGFRFSDGILVYPHVRWRSVKGLLHTDEAVAYELTTDDGHLARLYVLRQRVDDLPNAPPMRPARTTANCSVSVWRERGLVYLLVVRGDSAAYERFLNVPRGPIT